MNDNDRDRLATVRWGVVQGAFIVLGIIAGGALVLALLWAVLSGIIDAMDYYVNVLAMGPEHQPRWRSS